MTNLEASGRSRRVLLLMNLPSTLTRPTFFFGHAGRSLPVLSGRTSGRHSLARVAFTTTGGVA